MLPKKYGELQAKVAQTTPEIANKIAAARSPIAKSFYAQIGDIPMNEDIATAPMCEPGAGERVDFCPYSRTGWAIYYRNGMCSCRPAEPPK